MKIYLPRTITVSNKKNKETILKLARSRLPEKQKKAIYSDLIAATSIYMYFRTYCTA